LLEFYSVVTKMIKEDSGIEKLTSKESLVTKIVTGNSDLGV